MYFGERVADVTSSCTTNGRLITKCVVVSSFVCLIYWSTAQTLDALEVVYMSAADQTTHALREEVSDLQLRLKELGEENLSPTFALRMYSGRKAAGRAPSNAVFRAMMR